MEKPFTYSEDEVKQIIQQTINHTWPDFADNLREKVATELYEKLRKKEQQVFYRVCNENTLRGLWYDYNGKFTGIIHNEFNFCKHKDLEMDFDFDPELVGWLSATDTLEKLFEWFPIQDILKLQDEGWFLHKFVATDVKFYDRFQHLVISQDTSKCLGRIVLKDVSDIKTIEWSDFGIIQDGDVSVILIPD